jgi:hypothetical protein
LLQATGTSRSHGDESTTTTTRRTYALEQGDAHRAVALVATIQLPMDSELTHVVAASMTIAVAREGETDGRRRRRRGRGVLAGPRRDKLVVTVGSLARLSAERRRRRYRRGGVHGDSRRRR